MALPPPLRIKRNQLEAFLKDDFEAIRQFELLFRAVEALDPAGSEALEIAIGNAVASANDAKARVEALKALLAGLEGLLLQPYPQDHNSLKTDYVDLRRGAPAAHNVGRLHWNSDWATADLDGESDYHIRLGQTSLFYAKNTSGGTIDIGRAVMFSGSVGASGKLTFDNAVSNGTVPHEYLMGITGHDVSNNQFGYVVFFGVVRGFRTDGSDKTVPETWNDGDLLYMDPSYPGELTNVQPVAPNLHAPIAAVIRATSGNSGSIFVRALPGEALSELHDVYAPSPTNGQVLTWVSANSRWEAATAAGGSTWNIISTSQTLASGDQVVSNAVGAITLTLPATPSPGDNVTISNQGGVTLTVDRNGSNINSAASNATLAAGLSTQLVYVDGTIGWGEL
jgi:hypothetical protein